MTASTIGIMSPGDMGHAVGAALRARGLRVVAALDGRSERTRALAVEAGIVDVGALPALVRQADVLLSIMVPAQALRAAQDVATALREAGADLLYVDCNAIAPRTARAVAQAIDSAGGRCVDAGIIGGPPQPDRLGRTRFYASGRHAAAFAALSAFGLNVTVLGPEVGQASGYKMCYAAMTKGSQALGAELLVAAHALGLADRLREELRSSMPAVFAYLDGALPGMPPKAHRWVGEMEEIATTFSDLGLTPKMLQGAADVYRFVASTPPGQETPETRDRDRSAAALIEQLAQELPPAPSA
jgi:3-hydroxyisobutyrate dehydrogenase-like beta-hydroxyacid dehydrogenase